MKARLRRSRRDAVTDESCDLGCADTSLVEEMKRKGRARNTRVSLAVSTSEVMDREKKLLHQVSLLLARESGRIFCSVVPQWCIHLKPRLLEVKGNMGRFRWVV